ncbi:Uu.00g113970.m01.CDS01 [Anthostomella pinea]|uniref:Uu.00g113970.m01.CDS01 n=1 Tax=Anthostomella pinea TaxID=933095 RepID=A0AAI8YE67_9PEZI|nr:Uu.00g113970.m01.CDS01 [Anthostomella pinea]
MADVPTATSSVVLIADRCHIELGLAPWKRHRVGRTNPGLVSTYVRLAIGEEGYPVAANLDDFAFDKAGKTWVTTDFTSKVFIVDADGSGQLVVGGGSAAAFGRTWGDSQILEGRLGTNIYTPFTS